MAKIVKLMPTESGDFVKIAQECILLKEGDFWSALDPESNNELIKGASTDFIRNEIQRGRLLVDNGWDFKDK